MDPRTQDAAPTGRYETAEGTLQAAFAIHWFRYIEGGKKVIYADSSFLFSFYALDGNSAAAAAAYAADGRRPLLLSPWQWFELRNTVRLAVYRLKRAKLSTLFRPANVFKQVQEDLDVGRLRHAEVDWRESLRIADDLSASFTESAGAGAVDVWHVAAAVLLGADTFWTFDNEQRLLAERCGRFKQVPQLTA